MSSTTCSLSQNSINTINKLWGFENSTQTVIKQSENHTYLVKDNSEQSYILRLTPKHHRSVKSIWAELEYLNLIHDQAKLHSQDDKYALNVCPPIAKKVNENGEFLLIAELEEPYETDKEKVWYGVLFEYAQGNSVVDKWIGLTDDSMIVAIGDAMGRLHKIISEKAGNPERWDEMAKYIPEISGTHNGACDLNRIRERAQKDHEISKTLIQIYDAELAEFLKSHPIDSENYGIVHGDINVSNYFAKVQPEGTKLWIFDFDQVHNNYFGHELGVVLHTVTFFENDGLGIGKIEGFDGDRFRELFLNAYKNAYPPMAKYLDVESLKKFELLRAFYHTSIAADILYLKTENPESKNFEEAIIGFCQIVVDKFIKIHTQ